MPVHDAARATHDAITTVWRLEAARVIAAVARLTHDIGVAEELAGDALVTALERWPRDGVPANPGAWLTTTAKRRAIDHLRHRHMAAAEHDALALDDEARGALFVPSVTDVLIAAEADPVGDDLLRLIFTACHPVLSRDAQLALTLKLVAGLATDEIARAFLVSETTVAQRIVRAKRTLSEARVPFELPPREQLGERLSAVLEVMPRRVATTGCAPRCATRRCAWRACCRRWPRPSPKRTACRRCWRSRPRARRRA
jgi:RNA polymerase sigma factor (sigma-70 family)